MMGCGMESLQETQQNMNKKPFNKFQYLISILIRLSDMKYYCIQIWDMILIYQSGTSLYCALTRFLIKHQRTPLGAIYQLATISRHINEVEWRGYCDCLVLVINILILHPNFCCTGSPKTAGS